MKCYSKISIFLLIQSFVFCSYLSLYGFGDYVEDNHISSYFITESSHYFIEDISSTSIWDFPQSHFNITYNISSNDMDNIWVDKTYLNNISYTIPFGKSKYLSFGFNPVTISDINFQETEYNYIGSNNNPSNSPLSYNTQYISDGGISKAYLKFIYRVSDKFYLGIKNGYLFGNLEHKRLTRLYDIDYEVNDDGLFDVDNTIYTAIDSMIINKVNEFNGSNIEFEAKYKYENSDFFISSTYNFPLSIKMKAYLNPFINPQNESLGIFDNLEEMEYYTNPNQTFSYEMNSMFKKYSLGYRLRNSVNNFMLFKLTKQNGRNFHNNIMYFREPDIIRFDGLYSINKLKSNSNISYTFGGFCEILDFKNVNDRDYGAIVNFNFRFIDNNSFNICFKMGQRTHRLLDIDKEKYFSINISLENVEKWFLKGDD